MANRPFVLQEFPSRAGYKRNHPARSGGLQMGEGRATNPVQWGLYPRGGVKLQEFPSRARYKRNHPARSGLREGRRRIHPARWSTVNLLYGSRGGVLSSSLYLAGWAII
ncbi:hypothetical protein ACLB2K_004609 [Fragaria x ananassa]